MSFIFDWHYLFVLTMVYNYLVCFDVSYFRLWVCYECSFYIVEVFYEFILSICFKCYFYILVIYIFNLLEYNYLHLFTTYCWLTPLPLFPPCLIISSNTCTPFFISTSSKLTCLSCLCFKLYTIPTIISTIIV